MAVNDGGCSLPLKNVRARVKNFQFDRWRWSSGLASIPMAVGYTCAGNQRAAIESIGTFVGKRFERGLGIVLDVPLVKARDMADHIRSLLVDDTEKGFKNSKHRQQWRNSLKSYVRSKYDVPIGLVTV